MQSTAKAQLVTAPEAPAFSLIAESEAFSGLFEVFYSRDGVEGMVPFDVYGLTGLGECPKALHEKFQADMKNPSPKLDWMPTGDWDDDEQDYADKLSLPRLLQATQVPETGDTCDRTYLAFTKDDAGQVISYAAASVSVSFLLPGSYETVGFNEAWAWLVKSKRRNLTACVRVSLDEAYTLAAYRGRGANTAAMNYLSGIVFDCIDRLVATLSEFLVKYRKRLKLDLDLYSEWVSKSGCLTSGTLLTELESVLDGLSHQAHKEHLPVFIPTEVNYDAGF